MATIASTGKTRDKIEAPYRTGDAAWWGRDVSTMDQLPACLNGEYLFAVNAAGTGTVNMIGVDSSNNVLLPNGAVTPTGSIGLSTTVNLTAGQILTLHSAPVTLIAAPGAGKAIVVEQLLLEMTTTSTAFANGGAVSPVYHSATTALTGNTIPASVINAGAGVSYTLLALGAVSNGLTLTANTGVDLFAASADFITGTGTAKVIVWYKIVTL